MKIEKDSYFGIDIEFKNGIMFCFWQEWYQFFNLKGFNWCTINFFKIEFEYDRQCGHYEFTIVILGIGFRIVIPHENNKSKEFWKKVDKSMKKNDDYCHGWVNKHTYSCFKNKSIDAMTIYRTRRKATRKRLFIQ